MRFLFCRFHVIALLCYIYFSIQSIDGRSKTRFRSRNSRLLLKSEPLLDIKGYTGKFSHEWKTRAYTNRYIYVGYHGSWHYRQQELVNEWNVCFNLVFSGVNNTPFLNITSHEKLRSLSDEDYDLAADLVVSARLNLSSSSNGNDVKDEKDFTKPWQFMGMFVCPTFPEESTFKYCCGPEEFQYCCSFWETWEEFPVEEIIYGIVAIIFISVVIYAILKRRQRQLESLGELEIQTAVIFVPNDNIMNVTSQSVPESSQPLLVSCDVDVRSTGFFPLQDEEMKSQVSLSPASEGNNPPPYSIIPPPNYDFAKQPKA